MAVNYSILADVELNTSKIQQQLNRNLKGLKVNLDANNATRSLNSLNSSATDSYLTFQAGNVVFSRSVEIISSMVDQVYELDAAIIEFQKVSDLSGQSLDNYIGKLNEMGSSVARTGKPKCQAPDDGIVNQHQHPLEIQYNLKPIQLQWWLEIIVP